MTPLAASTEQKAANGQPISSTLPSAEAGEPTAVVRAERMLDGLGGWFSRAGTIVGKQFSTFWAEVQKVRRGTPE